MRDHLADDAPSRLWWGVRTYASILALVLVLVPGALVLSVAAKPLIYQAEALVIATELNMSERELGRVAEAVFASGSVAESAVRRGALPFDPRDLVPLKVTAEPVGESRAVKVLATDADPELATRIANAAADALVEDLNQAGPGVGVFAVKSRAVVPDEPIEQTSVPEALAVGLVAAGALGLGLVGLLVVVRRPLLGAFEASALAEAPVLAILHVPSGRPGRVVEPELVRGLSALSKQIFPKREGLGAIVACAGRNARRSQVSLLLARLLSRDGPVYLVAAPGSTLTERDLASIESSNLNLSKALRPEIQSGATPVVIDGLSASDYDVAQLLPSGVSVVLLVEEGTPQPNVEAAVQQFLPGALRGIAFVRRGRRGGRAPMKRISRSPKESEKTPSSRES